MAEKGVCKTCDNILYVSDNCLGCIAHDKFIMPKYPPYHGKAKCKDWREVSDSVKINIKS